MCCPPWAPGSCPEGWSSGGASTSCLYFGFLGLGFLMPVLRIKCILKERFQPITCNHIYIHIFYLQVFICKMFFDGELGPCPPCDHLSLVLVPAPVGVARGRPSTVCIKNNCIK